MLEIGGKLESAVFVALYSCTWLCPNVCQCVQGFYVDIEKFHFIKPSFNNGGASLWNKLQSVKDKQDM